MVVVLMPPPHEPGEAPINMKRIRINRVSLAMFPMDNVLNPAVLAVTDWKNEERNRFSMDSGERVLFHSKSKISAVPEISKTMVVDSTSLE